MLFTSREREIRTSLMPNGINGQQRVKGQRAAAASEAAEELAPAAAAAGRERAGAAAVFRCAAGALGYPAN